MAVEPIRIRSIEISNIRGFRKFDYDFDPDGSRHVAIVGRNGACKTSLLRCLALGLCGYSDAQALLAMPNGSLIREGTDEARIVVALTDDTRWAWMISRRGDKDEFSNIQVSSDGKKRSAEDQHQKLLAARFPFVCGYGLDRNRHGSEFGRSWRAYDSVQTLFNSGSTLVDSELVLRRLHDFLGSKRYDQTMAKVKQTLGLDRAQITFAKGGGVRLSGPGIGSDLPLEAWADGYRLTFSWMLDFFGWAMRAGAMDDEGNVNGILLIDEIEQHLHPSMQGGMLARLGKLLPNVQIIATTHSPLVALGAAPGRVLALHRRGTQVYKAEVPDLTSYSAEDALVSDVLFGTDPYAPRSRKKIERRAALAEIPPSRRSKAQRAELETLAREVQAPHPTEADDPVLAELQRLRHALVPGQS